MKAGARMPALFLAATETDTVCDWGPGCRPVNTPDRPISIDLALKTARLSEYLPKKENVVAV